MKFYTCFILLLLFVYINSNCEDEGFTPSKKKDCKDRLTDSDKNDGYSYCCFIEIKDGTKGCWKLTKDNYNNIKDYIKHEEEGMDGKVKTLYCNSLFLKLGLMNILFFLL